MNDTTFQSNSKVTYVPVVVDGKPHKQTNADRIRAMTDEELAEFVSGVEAEAIRRAGLFITTGDIKRGKDGWLDWLKQEAGE